MSSFIPPISYLVSLWKIAPQYSFFDAYLTASESIVSRSLSPENKRRTCGVREREEGWESGGEFDSLSTPPPAFPRNSRMRRKKARPLRVSFHSSGFVYPLPDKKALLARLSFVTDIPFVRGSRFHHHCCRLRHWNIIVVIIIVTVVQMLRHYRSLFREKKREELRKKNPLGSDGKTDVRKEVRPYWDWTDADARIGREGGEGGERVLRRWKSGGCSTSGIFPLATYVFLCDRRDRRPWWLPRRR